MRRMLVLGLLAALIVGAVAESASAVVPAKTYRSADGRFIIKVPRGALRKNVPITIVAKPKSSLPAKLRPDAMGGKIYEVKPHGLRFRKPVTIIWRIKKRGGFDASEGIPKVVLARRSPRGKWGMLGKQSTTLVGNILVARATTSRLSSVVAARGGVEITLTPDAVRRTVGESWMADVVLAGALDPTVFAGWTHGGVVQFGGEQTSTGNSRTASFKCGDEGTGTFGYSTSVKIARQAPNIAAIFLFLPLFDDSDYDIGLLGLNGEATCDPTPICAEPPRAAPTIHNGESKVQVTAGCAGLLQAGLDNANVSGSPAQITEYNAHSTSCTIEGAGVSVTCKTKPDGRICMILKFNPPLTPGAIVRVRLGKADGTILLDQNLTVGANGEANCSIGP